MEGTILTNGTEQLLLWGAVFLASFVTLLLAWSALVRTLFSLLGRSKLFFIPKTLKELFLTIAFIIALLSAEVVSLFTGRMLISGELSKIWQVLLVFAIANVIVRVALTGLDVQYRKARDRSGLHRSIGLLKGTVGIVLYLIASLIAINIMSTELGLAVMATGFFIILLLFIAGYDQVRSIVAGLQLGDYYVDVGNLVTIDGKTGFVENIHGRSTMLRTLDKGVVIIPNHHFFRSKFKVSTEDMCDIHVRVVLDSKDPLKARQRVSAIASKVSISREDVPKDYKPKVFQERIKDGKHVFMISIRVTPASDIQKLMDSLSAELASEFKAGISELRLEET